MEIQENRLLLEKESEIISQRAHGVIGQAIERTLQDWRLRSVQVEEEDLGRGRRGGSIVEKGVSVFEYRILTRYTQPVASRALRY
jgi:hypothetical protein